MIDRLLVGLGVALAVGSTSAAVLWQEAELARSELVYLPLAPVDPRSLVQGDYMRLRYRIERDLEPLPAPGEIVVTLDERDVASFSRAYDGGALGPGELRVDYFSRNRRNTVAPRAYLFQEGTADIYEQARFAIVAVTPEGRAALVGLADEELQRLGPPPRRF